jgi:acyl-CoA synthetase (NDP forming)
MSNIDSLFYPRAVAVFGSMSTGKLGSVLVHQILEGGFKDVFAINPKAQGLPGAPGYAALTEVGQPVDLAVIASPAASVVSVLDDCGQAGIKVAVIITSGFSEAGNQAGEAEVKETAKKYGIRFVGPNCAGVFNSHSNFYPTLELRPPVGETALLTQSGALGGAILGWAEEQGLGFSKFVSYGNRADLDEVELLDYLADDPETKVVAFYIESLAGGGRRFMQAARQFAQRKPLVVIKAGRTQSGQRATFSHTGSLAGSDAVYDSAFQQCGAIRVASVEEMFDLCKAFVSLPPLNGKRLAIVTNSGGPGVLAADRAEELGLQVAEPGPELRQALAAFLPSHCALKNPIDLTVEGTEETYRKTLSAMLQDYDAALALNVCPPFLPSLPLAKGVCAAARESGKPVVANFMAGRTVADSLPYLKEQGIPNFATGERAVAALAYMARRIPDSSLSDLPAAAKKQPAGPMLEPEALAWLAENDIPVPPFRWAWQNKAVLPACQELGYPLAMKVVSPDILHKSDSGGVILNINSNAEAQQAFAQLRQVAAGKDFRGVLMVPMIKDAFEVLLGISTDPQFGPVVAFGLGGVYTEILHDVSLRVAPVELPEARSMIQEIKSYPLLKGARGRPPADLEAMAQAIVKFSRLPFLYPEIRELDLNPVFLSSKGLVVGDVRVILNRKDAHL